MEQSQAATGDNGEPTVRNEITKTEGTDLGKRESIKQS